MATMHGDPPTAGQSIGLWALVVHPGTPGCLDVGGRRAPPLSSLRKEMVCYAILVIPSPLLNLQYQQDQP